MVRLDLALHRDGRENKYFSSVVLTRIVGVRKIGVKGEIKG